MLYSLKTRAQLSTKLLFFLTCTILQSTVVTTQLSLNNACPTYIDYATIDFNTNCWRNPDIGSPHVQVVTNNGYNIEEHEVTTHDGYILTILRILSRDLTLRKNGVVFLQHGIGADSMGFICFGSRSIAFQLVDLGYDVWIGNSRGTPLSRGHINPAIDDDQYWSFSFHELGIYDLPAAMNRISESTGSTQINFIGHSMGATQVLVYASMMPEHANAHLARIVVLAPVVYFTQAPPILQFFHRFQNVFQGVIDLFQIHAIEADAIANLPCRRFPNIYICIQTLFGVLGQENERLPPSDAQLFLRNYLSVTPVKSVLHYAQLVSAEPKFQQFDHGTTTNQILYKSSTPPSYPIEKITVPLHLFYSRKDSITSPKDVETIYDALINARNKTLTLIPIDDTKEPYSHVDFIIAMDLEFELLPNLLMRLEDYD